MTRKYYEEIMISKKGWEKYLLFEPFSWIWLSKENGIKKWKVANDTRVLYSFQYLKYQKLTVVWKKINLLIPIIFLFFFCVFSNAIGFS